MNIALYGGSFNPIHTAHTSICRYILDKKLCDKIWLIVSPHNPFKSSNSLADEKDRIKMARIAIESENLSEYVEVSDVEFHLPRPSYSYDTIQYLINKYPEHTFKMIIGADNYASISIWKNYEWIINNIQIIVYPRDGIRPDTKRWQGADIIFLDDAPNIDIAATNERSSSFENVNDEVKKYITDQNIYR